MIQERQGGGAPHAIILAIVVVILVQGPTLLSDLGESFTDAISEALSDLLSPLGFFLLPLALILTIQFLSSSRGSFICSFFSTGDPCTIHCHRVGGFQAGVALVLLLVFFILCNRLSNFGGGDEEDEGE